MKKFLIILSVILFVPNICAADKLLHIKDFVYLGSFRVPKDDLNSGHQYQGLAYGGAAIAYNPEHNSLYITGHVFNQQVAEISIPALVPIVNGDFSTINTASAIQDLVDITEGNRLNLKADGSAIEVNGCRIGGLLKYGNKLIGGVFAYYDAGHYAVKSHFTSGLTTTATGDFSGMFEVGTKPDPVPQAGFVGGYMTPIPPNWQTILGGPVITGMSTISVLGRTSSGPAAFAFDPDTLGPAAPAPAVPLVYYPESNQTIGTYYTSQTIYNKGSHHSGIIFPNGSRSIVYFGRQGLGKACYGTGTPNPEEDGNTGFSTYPDNMCNGYELVAENKCCYDPDNLEHGAHAYPYGDYVWIYDAADFARVRAGGRIVDDPSPNLAKSYIAQDGVTIVQGVDPTSTETYKPWHIQPYEYGAMTYPTPQLNLSLESGSAAYDEDSSTLYLVQVLTDSVWPVVHAYRVNLGYTQKTLYKIGGAIIKVPDNN